MAGLQGAGKTTTVGKLAKLPARASQEEGDGGQLRRLPSGRDRAAASTLAEQVEVMFFPSSPRRSRWKSCCAGCDAKRNFVDVLLVDTAGRLHIDEAMMAEIKALHAAVDPVETLFVVDSMTGQDAAVTAKAFAEALPLTGVVLTKTDGDARGGAALSVRYITGARSSSSVPAKSPMALECSIRTAWPSASSTWATCCRWWSRSSARSTGQGAEARREGRQGQEVRSGRHEGPARADAEHGRHGLADGQAAREWGAVRTGEVKGHRQARCRT
jgi:hypothetical protein